MFRPNSMDRPPRPATVPWLGGQASCRSSMTGYDRTCNLSCPSCRVALLVATRQEQEREEFQGILERVIRPALGSLKVLEFGNGEVLASSHLRSVVASTDRQQTPDLRVAIMTTPRSSTA